MSSTRPASKKLKIGERRIQHGASEKISLDDVLSPTVVISDSWKACKVAILAEHRVAEHHEQAADDGEVTKEEVEVENQTVAEALDDDYTEQTSDCVFRVPFSDNRP